MPRATLVLLAILALALPGAGGAAATDLPAAGPAPALRVCTGAWEPLLAPPATIRGLASVPGGILAVGSIVRGQALQLVARLRPTGWEVTAPPAGPGGTLAGVASAAGEAPWVAGSRVAIGSSAWIGRAVRDAAGDRVVPALVPTPAPAARAAGTGEATAAVPAPRTGVVLTGVAARPGDAGVAVGYTHGRSGQRALVVAWAGDRRTEVAIGAAADGRILRESALTAVAVDRSGDAWAVGWAETDAGIGPLLVRGDPAGWRPVAFPPGPGVETVLTAVRPDAGGGLLLAGYRTDGDRRRPFLVRRAPDGRLTEIPLPVTGSGVIRAILGDDPAGLVLGGALLPADVDTAALLLERDGERWRTAVPEGAARDASILALHAAPDGTLWAAGRTRGTGLAWRRCPVGTRAPAYPGPAPRLDVGPGVADPEGDAPDDPGTAAGAATRPRPAPRPAGGRGAAVVRPVWTVRDLAAERGLLLTSETYGGIVRDLDGDGRADLVVGTHAAPLRIFLARGRRFVPLDAPPFPRADRHGCAAADVDGSGLPDLFCTVGADRGLGTKRNELWLDPGVAGGARDVAASVGLVDPFGRGRSAAFLDVDADGDRDLAVFQDPTRQDGFPSRSRLYRNDAGRFTELPPGAIDPRSGGRCAITADVDRDGRTDLVTCANIGAADDAFLRIHRSAGGRLVPVPVPRAVADASVLAVTAADLGGGPEPELAIVAKSRLVVLARLPRGGWRIAWERRIPGATAIAAGDADGDGRADLYVVAGRNGRDIADLLLLARDAGAWEAVRIPPAPAGRGEAVLAIDPEQDGRDAFIVLNGQGIPGPLQLITIERSRPGTQEAIR